MTRKQFQHAQVERLLRAEAELELELTRIIERNRQLVTEISEAIYDDTDPQM